MARTKKAGTKQAKQAKPKKNKTKMEKEDLEDLEDFYLETESDTDDEDDDEDDDEFSLSKELDKEFIGSFDDIKDGDMTIPVLGFGLLAVLGFAIYQGSKI